MKRLFFALWPDTDTRERIYAISRMLPRKCGRLVPINNLHTTLGFLGDIDAHVCQDVQDTTSEIRSPAFSLQLDTIGKWPGAKVIWLAPSSIPEGLASLVTGLNKVASNCGVVIENRPYSPHITLARKAHGPAPYPVFTPFVWKVQGFSLVQSTTLPEGGRYEVIRNWSCGQ